LTFTEENKMSKDKTPKVVIAGNKANLARLGLVITLLAKENPKRPGSEARDRFALYKSGMTVAQFQAKGGKAVDIAWDLKHGFIKVGTGMTPKAAIKVAPVVKDTAVIAS
jgi:hypothetical protein